MPDETINIIIAKLDKLEDKIDRILEHGCSKSERHDGYDKRITSLELDRAKAVGAITIGSFVFGALGGWIMKKLGM